MSIKQDRFHRKFYFPAWAEDSLSEFLKELEKKKIVFTFHALWKIIDARFLHGEILLKYLIRSIRAGPTLGEIFEFYARGTFVTKICVRFSSPEIPVDVIAVISHDGVVITVYTIGKKDNHKSLNPNLYKKGD